MNNCIDSITIDIHDFRGINYDLTGTASLARYNNKKRIRSGLAVIKVGVDGA